MNGYKVALVESSKQLADFVKFPFSLFKEDPCWVPPIIKEEMAFFNARENPVFDTAEASLFLAYDSRGSIVGRIAVIVNRTEVEQQRIKKVRFGWLDMIDDIRVTELLLEKATEKAQLLGLDYIEGPMGFSNMDKVGVVTEGFDQLGTMITWNSKPYYKKHLEQLGFQKEKGFVEKYFLLENVNHSLFEKTAQIVKSRYGLQVLPLKTTKEILPYVDQMFELFNTTYSSLSSFVPISLRQQAYFKKKYIPFLTPEYIKFIVDKQQRLVCFAIVLPSFSKALQKARGKLFPFGFWHLLKAKRKHDTVDFYLIGVAPEYQGKGVPAILFDAYYPIFLSKGVKKCVLTPELEDNYSVQQLWKNFNPVDHIRRATYRKDIKFS